MILSQVNIRSIMRGTLYVHQVIYDWNGAQTYQKKILKRQNPGKVDCITVVTWSDDIFQASPKYALIDAKNKHQANLVVALKIN